MLIKTAIRCGATVIRHFCYSCIFFHSFSDKDHKLPNILRGLKWLFQQGSSRAFSQFLLVAVVFCSLTCFAGLTVWGCARSSRRRWGGGGGQGVRFVSFLRTTLRGLDAFDSPGMAVPFVVGFCLALKKSMERKTSYFISEHRCQDAQVYNRVELDSVWHLACMHAIMTARYLIYSGD